jgi:hypothetical protein
LLFVGFIVIVLTLVVMTGGRSKVWNGQRRKYRWAPKNVLPLIPGKVLACSWRLNSRVLLRFATGLPKYIDSEALNVEQIESLGMRVRIEEITQKLLTGNLEMGIEDRGRCVAGECSALVEVTRFVRRSSPSPEPIYDSVSGHRTNTRDLRVREKLAIERQYIIQDAQKICPVSFFVS